MVVPSCLQDLVGCLPQEKPKQVTMEVDQHGSSSFYSVELGDLHPSQGAVGVDVGSLRLGRFRESLNINSSTVEIWRPVMGKKPNWFLCAGLMYGFVVY